TPKTKRPPVITSSVASCSATSTGWWRGRSRHPVPSVMPSASAATRASVGIGWKAAGSALADDEAVGARVGVELRPLAVVVGDDERHAAVLDRLGHEGSLSPKDEGAARRRHRPAEVHRDLGVLDLTAPAGGVVVGVDSLCGARAVVVDRPAELADVLDHHGHAVRVALAQVAARGVVGAPAAELDDPARDVLTALALLAEAVLLELQQRRERERVVGAGDVHVLRTDA